MQLLVFTPEVVDIGTVVGRILQGQLDVQAAITAARLEETYQMDEWGLVEGGHDIDIADMQVRIAGPAVFLRLLKHAQ